MKTYEQHINCDTPKQGDWLITLDDELGEILTVYQFKDKKFLNNIRYQIKINKSGDYGILSRLSNVIEYKGFGTKEEMEEMMLVIKQGNKYNL